jgi:hypothetical protein
VLQQIGDLLTSQGLYVTTTGLLAAHVFENRTERQKLTQQNDVLSQQLRLAWQQNQQLSEKLLLNLSSVGRQPLSAPAQDVFQSNR